MQKDNSSTEKDLEQSAEPATAAPGNGNTAPEKHNPFDKNSPPLSPEETAELEQFKEAQTERD